MTPCVYGSCVGGVSDRVKVVYEEKSFKCISFNSDSGVLNIAMRLT